MKRRKVENLGLVVGRNVRRLRREQGMSLEDVAVVARDLELNWTHTRVSAIERGAREPKLQTLVILANALERPLGELLATDADLINLGDVVVDAAGLRAMYTATVPGVEPTPDGRSMAEWIASRGWGDAEHMRGDLGASPEALRAMATRNRLVDRRTAEKLGMDIDVLNAVCLELFDGRTFGEERDRLAAADPMLDLANATNALRDQLRQHTEGWPDRKLNPTAYGPEATA